MELTRRIEEASLNSWPALSQLVYDGWIVRLAKGYTKRANSVTPLATGDLEMTSKVEFCEKTYTRAGLPCVFRLVEPFPVDGLDDLLASRGYATVSPSLVMALDVGSEPEPDAPDREGIEVVPLRKPSRRPCSWLPPSPVGMPLT